MASVNRIPQVVVEATVFFLIARLRLDEQIPELFGGVSSEQLATKAALEGFDTIYSTSAEIILDNQRSTNPGSDNSPIRIFPSTRKGF